MIEIYPSPERHATPQPTPKPDVLCAGVGRLGRGCFEGWGLGLDCEIEKIRWLELHCRKKEKKRKEKTTINRCIGVVTFENVLRRVAAPGSPTIRNSYLASWFLPTVSGSLACLSSES